MSNTTENKLYLLVILGLIFFIPFYFSWQYNAPQKNIATQDITANSLNKKTKAKLRQISDEEYYHYSQDRLYKQPLLFNESHHALDSMPLLNEPAPQGEETINHDELLRHLQIRRKKPTQLYYLHQNKAVNQSTRVPQNQPQPKTFGIIHHRTTLEQLHNLQNIMQEKMKAAMVWYQHTNAQFQKIVQHQYAQHMQKREQSSQAPQNEPTELVQNSPSTPETRA